MSKSVYIITKSREVHKVDDIRTTSFACYTGTPFVMFIGQGRVIRIVEGTFEEALTLALTIPHVLLTESFLIKYGISIVYWSYYVEHGFFNKHLTHLLHIPHRSPDDEYEIMALLYLKRSVLKEIQLR